MSALAGLARPSAGPLPGQLLEYRALAAAAAQLPPLGPAPAPGDLLTSGRGGGRAEGRGAVLVPGVHDDSGGEEPAPVLRDKLARATEELQQLKARHAAELRAAEERGAQAGAAAAKREGEEAVKAALARAGTLLGAMEAEGRDYLKQVEREVIALALDVAYRVMRHEAQIDRLFLAGAVRAALDAMREGGEVRVLVPDQDLAGWEALLASAHFAGKRVAVAGDPAMQAGECAVRLANGTLDLGMRHQLGEIERTFASILGRRDARGGTSPVIEGRHAENRHPEDRPADARPIEDPPAGDRRAGPVAASGAAAARPVPPSVPPPEPQFVPSPEPASAAKRPAARAAKGAAQKAVLEGKPPETGAKPKPGAADFAAPRPGAKAPRTAEMRGGFA